MAHVSLEREEQFMRHIGQMIDEHTHIVRNESVQLKQMVHETLDRLRDHANQMEQRQHQTLDALDRLQQQLLK
jgi:hypothetical protein